MKLEYTAQILRGWPNQGARQRTELVPAGVNLVNGDWVEAQPNGTVNKTSIASTRRAGLVIRGPGDSSSAANVAGLMMTPGTALTVSAISAWTNGFMTVTTSTAHGYTVGNSVTIAGVTTTAVNGTYTVETVVDATNFTITLATTPGAITLGSPTVTLVSGYSIGGSAVVLWGNFIVATQNYDILDEVWAPGDPITVKNGKISKANGAAGTPIASTSITQVGGVATYTTATAHGFSVGQLVTVSGATAAGFNVTTTILSVPTPTTFTYAVASGTVSPATVQGSAVTARDPEVGFVLRAQGVTTTESAHLVAVIY